MLINPFQPIARMAILQRKNALHIPCHIANWETARLIIEPYSSLSISGVLEAYHKKYRL